jgi:hypothetical protein
MNLNDDQIKSVLEDFPTFELSYEIMIHKKVLNTNLCLAIPEGIKCFAWFTSYKQDLVCFILEITDNKKIKDIQIVVTSFNDKLALGTIFYGTKFIHNGISCFAIEDLYFYKGKNCLQYNYLKKINILKDILRLEISQTALTKPFTIFGLPVLNNDFHLLLNDISLLPYKVGQIKFRFFDNANAKKILCMNYFRPGTNHIKSCNNTNNNIINKAIFKVTADIEPDIYNLFMYNNGKEEYYDIAHIPDFKTSVMMNKLFRNIKENDNLDRLEESDNEDEFQDAREDKFVYLDRSFKINCEYNTKFKKWVPVSLADKRERIVLSSQLLNQNKIIKY